MRPTLTSLALVLALPLPVPLHGQGGKAAVPVPLNASTPIALTNARILWVEYRGRPALKLAEADPGYQWQRLRRESPGVYELYVDLEPGAWTKVKIEVKGTTARLFVNGASQPSLVVNDLKLGDGRGKIALRARISSEAYFSNLRVAPDP